MHEADTLPCFGRPDRSQRKPAVLPERRCGLELNRKCNEQLEVLSTLRGKLRSGYSQETGLGRNDRRDREISQFDSESTSRSGGEMSGVAAQAVADIDHGM